MKRYDLQIIKYINLFALLGLVIVNALANILPFNNLTTGEISDQVNVLFTPAGYVFSIWSIIYLLLFIWALRPFFKRHLRDKEAYENIGTLFLLNALLNSSWLYLFHYQYFIGTLIVMISLLVNIIIIYRRLRTVKEVSIWSKLPFSIYLGWISVATIVNVGIFFNTLGYEDGVILGPQSWTIILLFLASILAIGFTHVKKDTVFPLVFVWAFIGIALERLDSFPAISYTACGLASIVLIYVIFQMVKMRGFYPKND
ncbi:TspO/MBR family protein [Salipaludibacillus sp. CF4.18]|uniref:TspO/MBR family protein n=1 Tax=Salipaludibacillus sp. CF4.18 TaxID=3373081 RepID=UPI003EE7C18D